MLEDILKDSWAFQEWMQRGEERGIEKGVKQGALEGQQQTLLLIVQAHFPGLAQLARERVARANSAEAIQQLILDISMVKEEQQAQQLLLALTSES